MKSDDEAEEEEEEEQPKKKQKKKTVETTVGLNPEPGMSKEMNEKVSVKVYIKYKKDPRMIIDISPLQDNRKDGKIQKFGLKIVKPVILRPDLVSMLPTDISALWAEEMNEDNIVSVVNRSSMALLGFISNGGSIEGDYTNPWGVILTAPSNQQVMKELSLYLRSDRYRDNKLSQFALNRKSPLPLHLEENEILIYQNSYKLPANDKYNIIVPIDEFEQYRSQISYIRPLNRTNNSAIMIEMNPDLVIAEVMIQRTLPMEVPFIFDVEEYSKKLKRMKKRYVNFRGERGLGSTDYMK